MEKRAKKTEGGLLSGSANKVANKRLEQISGSLILLYSTTFFSAWNASSHEAIEDEGDPLEFAGGEFDEDEPVESV